MLFFNKLRRVIYDTDGGVDDAIGLALLLSLPDRVHVWGITCVFGNVSVDQCFSNMSLIAEPLARSYGDERRVPVFRGAASALVHDTTTYRWPGHGLDGLGDKHGLLSSAFLARDPAAEGRGPAGAHPEPHAHPGPHAGPHAALALVDAVRNHGVSTVIAVGPLTNLALALRLCPEICELVEVVVMGGSDTGKGNTTPCAEFNFFLDPEAADVVLRGFKSVRLVTWDAALSAPLGWHWFDAMVGVENPSPGALLLGSICDHYQRLTRSSDRKAGDETFVPCDAYAVASFIDDAVNGAVVRAHARVACALGTISHGSLVIDHYDRQAKELSRVAIVTKINAAVFEAMMTRAFASPAPRPTRRELFLDHDGGVDDLIVVMFLAGLRERLEVKAIAVTPADCFIDTAMEATRILCKLLRLECPVSRGTIEGPRPFPDMWRAHSDVVVRQLRAAQEAGHIPTADLVDEDPRGAVALLLDTLQDAKARGVKVTLLFTGPLTNLAAALDDPARGRLVEEVVERLFFMGGAIDCMGNVEPGTTPATVDSSAEWNVFCDAPAADRVWRSSVPITLVSLDATNKVPITREFLNLLSTQVPKHPLSKLALDAWEHTQSDAFVYQMWDTLTCVVAAYPHKFQTTDVRCHIVLDGPAEGRTMRSADPRSRVIQVLMDANRDEIYRVVLDLLTHDGSL